MKASPHPATGPSPALPCFLLTRQWRDTPEGLQLTLWAASDRGPVRIVVRNEQAVCFVERGAGDRLPALADRAAERRPLELRTLHDGMAVDGLYFRRQRALIEAREQLRAQGVRCHESDIKPVERYLMERFVNAAFEVAGEAHDGGGFSEFIDPPLRACRYRAPLRVVSLDIETEGLDGALYSIAVAGDDDSRVFMVGHPPVQGASVAVETVADEAAALRAFEHWLERHDPDVLIGWNVVAFDLDFLLRRAQRLGVRLTLGRGGERAAVLPPGNGGTSVARVPGRLVLDGIEALRTSFRRFESFQLEHVASELLGRGKTLQPARDRVAEITRLYNEDRVALADYNIEDCRLVRDIFEHTALIEFLVRRAELTGLALDRSGGSVAAFDHLYLPRLHRRGRVAPDTGANDSHGTSPGGHVLDSRPGLYENVLLLDFKSLYPSIVRTFQVDPLGLAEPGDDPVPGFEGARFAREGGILPALIGELAAVREEARGAHDAPLSQAVKIIMNSFYGVLGTSGCRFHDARLASSITRRGHEVMQRSRERIEARGQQVIYGDTDSLFVLLGNGVPAAEARATGNAMARELNDWWRTTLREELRVESRLEIEFETHFGRFLMPTVRGEETGSKKRYAGLVCHADGREELLFRGLESVRTDWTPLARRFQRELYRRVFQDEPWRDYVSATVDDLMAGRLDDELVYRKRLRRDLAEYTRNAPPHVQAARLLGGNPRWVRYVVTATGPQPVVAGEAPPRPDYGHYRDRQLAPAADGLLHFLGDSFGAITDEQLSMF